MASQASTRRSMIRRLGSTPGRIALTYLCLSVAWIVVTDFVTARFFAGSEASVEIGIVKGLLFVLVTSILVYGLASVSADAARFDQTREQLEYTRNVLEKTLGSIDDAVFVVDPVDRRILAANPAVERVFGWKPSELIGRTTEALHVDRDRFESFGETSEPVLEHDSAFRSRFQMRRRDGSLIDTENTVTTLHPDLGWWGGVISVVRDITARIEREERLEQQQRQLAALSRRLIEVQEEERARISREIHDELGQTLTGIRYAVDAFEQTRSSDSKERTSEARAAVDARLAEMHAAIRRVAHELRPAVLDHLGLQEALRDAARDFEDRTGLLVELSTTEHASKLSREAATAAYRILQEALTNVARHAQASIVDVRLRPRGEEVILEVRDDGIGFTSGVAENSLGILMMKERAELCGGTLEVRSMPGDGTIVRAILPNGVLQGSSS